MWRQPSSCVCVCVVSEHAQAELRDLRRELQELLTVSLKGGPACTSDVAKAVLADLDDEGDTGDGEERAVRSVQVAFVRSLALTLVRHEQCTHRGRAGSYTRMWTHDPW